MVDHIPITGVVVDVTFNGDRVTDFPVEGVGPASKIKYTVLFNDPRTRQPVRMVDVEPQHERWDDSIKTRPARPGTGITGVTMHGLIHFTIIEMPGTRACDAATPRPNQQQAIGGAP